MGAYKGVRQINDTENSDWFEAQSFLDPTGIEIDATVEEPPESEVTNEEPDDGSSYVERAGELPKQPKLAGTHTPGSGKANWSGSIERELSYGILIQRAC